MLLPALFIFLSLTATSQYRLHAVAIDKDSGIIRQTGIKNVFARKLDCELYISKLPSLLSSKGYPASSVDSVSLDSTHAFVKIYFGDSYHFDFINTDSVDPTLLKSIRWDVLNKKKGVSFQQFEEMRNRILDELENDGYPFGNVQLDSITVSNGSWFGRLRVNKGPRYKIDSIRNLGDANISTAFLQRHLGILNSSYYRRDRLRTISRKIEELPYLKEQQPFNMTMLGTGSIVNLYLQSKKSSQVNVLIGLLPASEQGGNSKMQVTGDALIHLRNSLGNGESIGLNWQQIQVRSPRLNVFFTQPYLFNSPFGINFNFDLLKKDSSYVNISILLGVQYALSSNQSGSVFFQSFRSNLLTVDTFVVKNSRRLPQEADITSMNIGVNYDWFNTDYRLSPRKGNEVQLTLTAGTKTLRKNNVIVKLRDVSDPSFNFNSLYDTLTLKGYQFRMKASAAHYFPLTKSSSLKTSLTAGWFQSPDIFRNELFQIGGYKLLRGFDEESIFASGFAIAGTEYRYFLGVNSFLFAFIDYGLVRNETVPNKKGNSFLGAGLGMAFETKAGIFNISYAAGKRGGDKLNLRQSKIHLGYVNYF